MSDVLQLKQHDTAPAFRAQLLDGDAPVDLATAKAVRFLMSNQRGDLLVTGPMVKDGQPGWVRRAWGSTDLATSGVVRFEVEVTWADDTVQTFPPTGYAEGYISPDLG